MANTYSDKLFLVNERKGTLEVNKVEVRQISAFKEILERDKGKKVKGDPDGRKKLFACMEFFYIYVMADPFTMYSILNDKRKHKQALESSGLKGYPDWKPDKKVIKAIETYKKLIPLSPIASAYINARKAIYNVGEDVKLFNDYSEELREKIKEAKADLESDDETIVQESRVALGNHMKALNRNNKEILEITSTLPDRLDSLDKLKNKLSEEDNERGQVIGGGLIYEEEDPRIL